MHLCTASSRQTSGELVFRLIFALFYLLSKWIFVQVLVGDLNISAYPIDHCSPESFVITREFRSTIPSAPEGCGESHSSKNKDRVRLIDVDTFAERPHNKWIVDLITRVGMVDSFRLLHPEVGVVIFFKD